MRLKSFVLAFSLFVSFSATVLADHVAQSDIRPDVPRDAIPPLDSPNYDSITAARWNDDDWMLVFEHNGDVRAYPVNIMNWHEIINETIGGLAVLVSYCPLCRSGLVFDRHLSEAKVPAQAQGVLPDDTIIEFGNTGSLYESDMVMYDRQSESQWFQVGGEALIGSLHGVKLKRLPSTMMPWAQFKTLYPNGRVLSRDTGYRATRDYDHDIFERYSQNPDNLYFYVSKVDPRLPAKTRVLGLSGQQQSKAYNLERLDDGVYPDQLDEQPVVLFVEDGAGMAFDPGVDERQLTFVYEDGRFKDEQTQSTWGFTGTAEAGELKGKSLRPLVQSNLYWFSWAIHEPDTLVLPEPDDFSPYQVRATGGSLPVWLWGALGVLVLGGVWAARSRPKPS